MPDKHAQPSCLGSELTTMRRTLYLPIAGLVPDARCLLYTGHLASETRPHSWLSHGREAVEGPSAVPQDSAVMLAVLQSAIPFTSS